MIVSAPMCTRSGNRARCVGRGARGGQLRERACRDADCAQRAAEREPARPFADGRSRPSVAAGCSSARRPRTRGRGWSRRSRSRPPRTRRPSPRSPAMRSSSATAAVLQVVERLRQAQPDRDLVGEVGRAPRPPVAELGEQRRRGCPSSTAPPGSGGRCRGRPRPCPVAAMSALAAARTRSSTPGSSVTPPSAGMTATRRPARSCVPSPASQPPGCGRLDGSRGS